jgi:hypothetical protein
MSEGRVERRLAAAGTAAVQPDGLPEGEDDPKKAAMFGYIGQDERFGRPLCSLLLNLQESCLAENFLQKQQKWREALRR